MNDHHFSYPRVVPLRWTTISGHAVAQPQAPSASRPAEPPLHYIPAPAPRAVTLAA